jgi:hypothetical protein
MREVDPIGVAPRFLKGRGIFLSSGPVGITDTLTSEARLTPHRRDANCLPDLMELSYACNGNAGQYCQTLGACIDCRSSMKSGISNQEIDVNKLLLPMIGVLAAVVVCGCNGAKSPAAVATDVAEARQQASTEVMDAQKDAAKNVDAAASTDGSSKDRNDVGARSTYDVAVAQADGDHNVAIQQCLALTGEAQKSCKERADAAYDQAKTHANVTRLSQIQ